MALFGKKKETASPAEAENAAILVLGGGCAKCEALETSAREALASLGCDEPIGHIRDFGEIAKYGVMSTPALVIDGKVVSSGRALGRDEVAKLLREAGR